MLQARAIDVDWGAAGAVWRRPGLKHQQGMMPSVSVCLETDLARWHRAYRWPGAPKWGQ